MVNIRDSDKQKLIDARNSLGTSNHAWHLIDEVLTSIDDLSHQAPVIEPQIVPMSEADKRICYPERYR